MDYKKTIEIPAGEFGKIVMCAPGIRRQITMTNSIARVRGTDKVELKDTDLGYITLRNILMYVRDAPFSPEPDGFLAWCDDVERETGDAALTNEIYAKMAEAAKEIMNGDPSHSSAGAVTPPSE